MAVLHLKEKVQFLTIEGKKVYRDELLKRANELYENGYAHYFFTQEQTEVKEKTEPEKASKKKSE